MKPTITHEQYVNAIARYVVAHAHDSDRDRLCKARILYGAGQPNLRGVTYYDRWHTSDGTSVDMVEICALGESSPVQVAGTVIHELAHVAAGHKAGHGKEWKQAADRLGLRLAKAAGMHYLPANLAPDIRELIVTLLPTDGKPNGFDLITGMPVNPLTGRIMSPKACPLGIGVKGGKSRGKGSGSRLRKYVCECQPKPVIIRAATDSLDATCNICNIAFKLA